MAKNILIVDDSATMRKIIMTSRTSTTLAAMAARMKANIMATTRPKS